MVPQSQEDKARTEAIRGELQQMTAAFCDRYLNDEYKELASRLVDKLGRKRVAPFLQGRPNAWAAGVIYALAQINFLFNKKCDPHISPDGIAGYFGVAKTTAAQKARDIRALLRLRLQEPEFSTAEAQRRMPTHLAMRLAWEEALQEMGISRRKY